VAIVSSTDFSPVKKGLGRPICVRVGARAAKGKRKVIKGIKRLFIVPTHLTFFQEGANNYKLTSNIPQLKFIIQMSGKKSNFLIMAAKNYFPFKFWIYKV